jgi:hypothetical protein
MTSSSTATVAGPTVVSPTVETFDRVRDTATMKSVDIEDYFVFLLFDMFLTNSPGLLIRMRILSCLIS